MPTTLTSEELENLVVSRVSRRLRGNVIAYDGTYVLHDDQHCPAFMDDLAKETAHILGGWRTEYRDCDKFARLVQALAIAAHAKSWIDDEREVVGGLAVGTLSYTKDSGERHAVNLILTKVLGQQQVNVRTFEPQTGDELFLSETERNSCFKLVI